MARLPDGRFHVRSGGQDVALPPAQAAQAVGLPLADFESRMAQATQAALAAPRPAAGSPPAAPPIWQGRARHGDYAEVISRNPDGTFQVRVAGKELTRTERDVAYMTGLTKAPLYAMLAKATEGRMEETRTRDFSGPSLSQPPRGESRMQYASPVDPSKDSPPTANTDVNQSATSQDPKPATIDEAITLLQPLADEARMLGDEKAKIKEEKLWAELRIRQDASFNSTRVTNSRPGAPAAPQVMKQSLSSIEMQKLEEEVSRAKERLIAIENREAELSQRAREMLSVPREVQGHVTVINDWYIKLFEPELYNIVKSGNELVASYVHPSLLPNVSVEKTSGVRAGYDSHTGTIRINISRGRPDIVMHEVTHGIEWKQKVVHENGKTIISYPVMEKAYAFLMKRAGNEKPQRMKDLDPENASFYEDDEMAYEDQWKEKGGDPYCGKIYDAKSTEILTVGIQRLNKNPLLFLQQDPEYFTFVVSTLRYPVL